MDENIEFYKEYSVPRNLSWIYLVFFYYIY